MEAVLQNQAAVVSAMTGFSDTVFPDFLRRAFRTLDHQDLSLLFCSGEFFSVGASRSALSNFRLESSCGAVGEWQIRGKIVALHGKKGLVRVRFGEGVSGQFLGTRVEVRAV